jgi:hypothetical protein
MKLIQPSFKNGFETQGANNVDESLIDGKSSNNIFGHQIFGYHNQNTFNNDFDPNLMQMQHHMMGGGGGSLVGNGVNGLALGGLGSKITDSRPVPMI